ncbi:MAG: ornithine carbamoyltransferase [Alphaproteobacteria bacterium]|nr:ornithine carbamoyltransferase [Alphaproteobacteria bacterium]
MNAAVQPATAPAPAPQNFLTLRDAGSKQELQTRIAEGLAWRGNRQLTADALAGKSIALLFEKPSTRTRVSFEVGIREMGGHPIVLYAKDMQLKRGETLADTARVLSCYVDAIVMRTTGHGRLEEMAAAATVPVINSLSDHEHPCQIIADLMAVQAHADVLGKPLDAMEIAWLGDVNNVTNSWMAAASMLGLRMRVGAPERFGNLVAAANPSPPTTSSSSHSASAGGAESGMARITHHANAADAVRGADVVITDTWHSMHADGTESAEEIATTSREFEAYRVDQALMEQASASAIFLHCLPAHRGMEVTSEVLEGKQSKIWEAAENRMHGQKAILAWLLADRNA